MNYTTIRSKKTIIFALIAAVVLAVTCVVHAGNLAARAEEQLITCWVMCKPGDYVNVREWASTSAQAVGYLESGDSFQTDGSSRNGFIKAIELGECSESWVYSGYVVTEEPVPVFENYSCCAIKRVAIRRWMGGPKVEKTPWLVNGSDVSVFYIADGWAITNRGYIQSEWLEADPE